jgi:succinoglycan biosynthesis protein ExoO
LEMSTSEDASSVPHHEFSVVIPLFNKAPHVCRAINSVLAQTCSPLEVIVIDDGSTDGGQELVASYSRYGVTLLERGRPGAGGYAARNLGVQSARSRWIAFLDADDEWHPGHLSNLADGISSSNNPGRLVGVFAGYLNEHANGYRCPDQFTRSQPHRAAVELSFEEFLEVWLRLRACPVWTSASAFKRDALFKAGLFPDGRAKRGGDKDTWLRLAALGRLKVASGVTATYHRDAVNMVSQNTSTNMRHCICESVEKLAATAPTRTRKLLFRVLNEEIFQYGVYTTHTGPVDREAFRGFRPLLDPGKYLLLLAASTRIGAAALQVTRRVRDTLDGTFS